MKTIFLKVTTLIIILASFLVMNTSCENNSPSTNSIVGTWVNGYGEDDQKMTLNKDGSAYFYNFWGTGSGSYTYNAKTMVLVFNTPHGTKTYVSVTIQNNHMTGINAESGNSISFTKK